MTQRPPHWSQLLIAYALVAIAGLLALGIIGEALFYLTKGAR